MNRVGTGPIKVLLVDDHTMFRQGLANILTSYGGMEVVAEVPNDEVALRPVHADLLQRWSERRSLATSNGTWACRLLGTLFLPHFVDDRVRAKTAWSAPSPATEQHNGRDDENDQGQAKQDDLHSSDDQGGYLLSFVLYTRTTSVITLLGAPLCREHIGNTLE